MQRLMMIVLAAVIALAFIAYMLTYTVRFTEAAVVTTFGKVSASGVVTEPGVKFKWPAPIQSVTIYDTRLREMSSRSETQQTADDRQIVVEMFLAWKVKDPLKFNQRFGRSGATGEHYNQAEKVLSDLLRSSMAEVSKFNLSDLFSPKAGDSKLGALEQDIAARLKQGGSGGENVDQYGIEVAFVGVNRVVLPESTTSQVFERMKQTMITKASKASSEGQAAAAQITSQANNDAERIRAFAMLRAAQITNQGDIEAAKFLSAQSVDPELASFLKEAEFVRNGFGKKVTLIVDTASFGFNFMNPAIIQQLQQKATQGGKTSDASPASSGSGGSVPAPAASPAQPAQASTPTKSKLDDSAANPQDGHGS